MGFAVELYFDAATEASLRELWEALSNEGISDVMPSIGARPHISLATFECIDLVSLREELRSLARVAQPLTVTLGAVGTFPTAEGVVYLAPVVTQEFLSLHKRLHARLSDLGIASAEYYRPGKWIPHCTAAIDLDAEEVSSAVDLCLRSNVFVTARLTEIGLIEFRPVRDICVFPLLRGA